MARLVKLDAPEVMQALEIQRMLESDFSARNQQNERYDKIYNMDWNFTGELEGIDTIITTTSPSIRNRILGMRRLLDGTDLLIRASSQDINFDKDGLERSLDRWVRQSSKIGHKKIVSDIALSALLFGEIQVGLDSTKAMVEAVATNRKKRAKAVADQVPFLISTWHPNEGRYLTDAYGLTHFSRKTETTWGKVQSSFAQYLSPDDMLRKPNDTCELTRFWTLDNFFIFVDDKPIYMVEHKMEEIPVTVQLVDGSQLYSKVEEQRQSVLFAVDKAGYFEQQSVILTLMASIIFAMGVAPLYKHQLPPGDEGRKLEIDYSVPGGAIHLLPGESYDPVDNRGLIDPALRELYMNNEQNIEQATIYNTALGAPVESNIAFSTVSLLAQQGRLPLAGPQRAIGDTFSSFMELALRLLATSKSAYNSNGIDLNPSTLPKDLQIEATIDIKLPQDKLQLANIAHMLKGDNLADTEWIQTNILNITDTTTMARNILLDQMRGALGEAKIGALVEVYKAKTAQEQSGAAGASGTPGQPAPMGGVGQVGQPATVPDQAIFGAPAAPMAPGAGMAATGTPPSEILGGLPSAQGGMLPSQGRGVVPMDGV